MEKKWYLKKSLVKKLQINFDIEKINCNKYNYCTKKNNQIMIKIITTNKRRMIIDNCQLLCKVKNENIQKRG